MSRHPQFSSTPATTRNENARGGKKNVSQFRTKSSWKLRKVCRWKVSGFRLQSVFLGESLASVIKLALGGFLRIALCIRIWINISINLYSFNFLRCSQAFHLNLSFSRLSKNVNWFKILIKSDEFLLTFSFCALINWSKLTED